MTLPVHSIAKALEASGITVLKVDEGDEVTDAAVYITDKIHVQVPTADYAGETIGWLVRGDDEAGFQFGPFRYDVPRLTQDIRHVMGGGDFPEDDDAAEL